MQAWQKSEQIADLSEFKPAWWLKNCHLQTILAKYLAPRQPLFYRPELFNLPDGDELMLSWGEKSPQNSKALVVILHGLEGNIHSHYVRGMLASLQQQGFAVVLMHFRGCHGEANKLPRAYHSGDTADFAFVLQQLGERYPGLPLAGVGFSLGGNVLMKYLGETAEHCPLKAAAAVSAPLQLSASADRINQGFSKFYQRYLLKRLKGTMQRKLKRHHNFPLPVTYTDIQRLGTIRDFDQQLTAPLHGFLDAEDYYQKASAKPYLRHIKRPTLLIHAKDDPFLAADVIPTAAELSPHSRLLVSEYGGHVGFVCGGLPWKPVYWLDQVVPAFLQQHLL
ncbi:hydrolase [Rheinheimera sp.]|uniref:hydrolase n=1 Tax=Rheinheimera sp. TaxID=1869214 RepID=UPI0027B8E700|nr:hydrolase [Rheinheimera sp.]